MRKLLLNLAISLDGLIEGPNGEYDWCFTDNDYGMTAFTDRTDAILFGRKSYDVLQQYDSNAYPDKQKIVCSRTLQTNAPNTQIIAGDLISEITALKQQPGRDIWLFGGAELTTTCLNANLVDEMHLSIHPIVLGQGKPLFTHINARKYFKVMDTKIYESGLVQVIYQYAG